VTVSAGAEVAVAAALGPAADALAVADVDAVTAAFSWLREADAGRAALVAAVDSAPGSGSPPGSGSGPGSGDDLDDFFRDRVDEADEPTRLRLVLLRDPTE
nr:hypothetical protein [Micromonospora sp. DSM 115978]